MLKNLRKNHGLPKRSKRIAKRIGRSDTTLNKLEVLHDAASVDTRSFGELWHKVNSNKISANKAFNIYKRILQREQLLKESQHAQLVKSDNVRLIYGDFTEVSKEIPHDSVDLIFTDPLYYAVS
ncbi:MAG: hypothetical protein WBP64_03660 [Nitrososphaeraceae archaeon]